MEERKFVTLKKEEYAIKEFVKSYLGKGKVSNVHIEYTPVGEKVIIRTSKPGLIIGRGGERISSLTDVLKRKFKFENPHIEIQEIKNQYLDSQAIADEIALNIESVGTSKFKIISYRLLTQIMGAGALGAEIKVSGKLPAARAKTWRFTKGYLKKVGDNSKIVDKASSVAQAKAGTVGITVSILHPDAKIHDIIDLSSKKIKLLEEKNVKI